MTGPSHVIGFGLAPDTGQLASGWRHDAGPLHGPTPRKPAMPRDPRGPYDATSVRAVIRGPRDGTDPIGFGLAMASKTSCAPRPARQLRRDLGSGRNTGPHDPGEATKVMAHASPMPREVNGWRATPDLLSHVRSKTGRKVRTQYRPTAKRTASRTPLGNPQTQSPDTRSFGGEEVS